MKLYSKLILTTACLLLSQLSIGQRYITQNGNIQFFSETPVENIEAVNNQVSSVIDLANGNMAFSLLMKAFTFEKALMQEHFNEKYVESEKFPKSTFKGQILNFDKESLGEGLQQVKVSGELTIHGETQEIEAPGTMELKGEKLLVNSTFTIPLADYKVKIPAAVDDKIAETIEIQVKCEYEGMD